MIKVTNIALDDVRKEAKVSLFADSTGDATTDTTLIDGFPKGYKIAFGSSIITADGDMAFFKSTGQWNWV